MSNTKDSHLDVIKDYTPFTARAYKAEQFVCDLYTAIKHPVDDYKNEMEKHDSLFTPEELEQFAQLLSECKEVWDSSRLPRPPPYVPSPFVAAEPLLCGLEFNSRKNKLAARNAAKNFISCTNQGDQAQAAKVQLELKKAVTTATATPTSKSVLNSNNSGTRTTANNSISKKLEEKESYKQYNNDEYYFDDLRDRLAFLEWLKMGNRRIQSYNEVMKDRKALFQVITKLQLLTLCPRRAVIMRYNPKNRNYLDREEEFDLANYGCGDVPLNTINNNVPVPTPDTAPFPVVQVKKVKSSSKTKAPAKIVVKKKNGTQNNSGVSVNVLKGKVSQKMNHQNQSQDIICNNITTCTISANKKSNLKLYRKLGKLGSATTNNRSSVSVSAKAEKPVVVVDNEMSIISGEIKIQTTGLVNNEIMEMYVTFCGESQAGYCRKCQNICLCALKTLPSDDILEKIYYIYHNDLPFIKLKR